MAAPTPSEIQYQIEHVNQDRSSDIVVSHIICITLATVAVILRFASRRVCKAAILADDYMIIAALVLVAGEVTGGLLCVQNGGGKHAILLKNPTKFAKLVLTTEMFMPSAIAAVKISILLLYLRIFPSQRLRIIAWTIGCFVASCAVTQTLLVMFQCRPIQAAWDVGIKGDCVRLNLSYVIFGSFNALTDIIALCMPMPYLWQLHADRTRKVQLMGTFGLGVLICVVSLYRIPKMWDISLSDAPYSDVQPCVWAIVESCVAIFCACLPTFPALTKIIRDSRRLGGNAKNISSLDSDDPQLGYKSSVGNNRKEFVRMGDWAETPQIEKGDAAFPARKGSASL